MEKEEWKDIRGLEGYQVSSLGRVRYKDTGEIRHIPYNSRGYAVMGFRTESGRKCFYVHRLVANAFVPNPDNKPDVDHLNTIKSDNRAINLRWVTRKENQNNPITHKKMVAFANSENHFRKKVFQYSLAGEFLSEYESLISASCKSGVGKCSISACIRGITRRGGNYIWRTQKVERTKE